MRWLWGAIVMIVVFLLVQIVWLVYPYDRFSYSRPSPIMTPELTDDEVPVIRFGDPVRWDQPYCNRGAHPARTVAWVDVFSEPDSERILAEGVDGRELPVAAVEVKTELSWIRREGCYVRDVEIDLPPFLKAGRAYRMRLETSYEANPIRAPHVEVETELFLLADVW